MSAIAQSLPTISTLSLVLGIAIGIALAVLLVGFRTRYHDLFPALLVAGIAGLAIVVTILRVDQYWSSPQPATATTEAYAPAYGGGKPQSRPEPPTGLRSFGPMVRGPTGGAAPPPKSDLRTGNGE